MLKSKGTVFPNTDRWDASEKNIMRYVMREWEKLIYLLYFIADVTLSVIALGLNFHS